MTGADASLPDRVEAAALHPHTLEMIEGRARSALDATLSPELALSVVRRDVPVLIAEVRRLAAADACEAERNPNTTDEYEQTRWWMREYVTQEGNEATAFQPTPPSVFQNADEWEPVCRRRPVSSEDVHREAAE